MKEITRYEAIDGKVFDDKEECKRYDFIAQTIQDYRDTLPLKGEVFGDGYIQHAPNTKDITANLIISLANTWFKTVEFDSMSYSLGRYIDDSNMKCLNRLMHMYSCIDAKERQWEQAYYANNPSKGVQKKLNNL